MSFLTNHIIELTTSPGNGRGADMCFERSHKSTFESAAAKN